MTIKHRLFYPFGIVRALHSVAKHRHEARVAKLLLDASDTIEDLQMRLNKMAAIARQLNAEHGA